MQVLGKKQKILYMEAIAGALRVEPPMPEKVFRNFIELGRAKLQLEISFQKYEEFFAAIWLKF